MLIWFRLANHRSIRDEQALSLEPGNVDGSGERVREAGGTSLLSLIAIYGANASGKSNLLGGLAFMRDAVVRSHRFFAPEGGIPRTPFAWGTKAAEPSLFEIAFQLDGVRYEYGFCADDQRFTEEWLYAYPSTRKQTWFERDGDELKLGENLHGENRTIEKITRPNSLFLSAAAQNRHAQLSPVFRWFAAIRNLNLRTPARWSFQAGSSPPPANFAHWWKARSSIPVEDQAERLDVRQAQFRELLRAADFGIDDIEVLGDPTSRHRVMVKHRSARDDAWLPLEEESHGTQQVFALAPSALDALASGSLLLIDELDASLHPLLSLKLIETFHDPRQNPRNAQLLFTTHDTALLGSLLGAAPLRRDQVWLTEKDDEGATRIYPLTDFRPRKEENLERGYLQGRYGAIPFLEQLVRDPADKADEAAPANLAGPADAE
ncbi:MAG: ATP-binding protein [Myxococcales bacterium]|nr:ATP-binding protein [Myxococcales bacterium]